MEMVEVFMDVQLHIVGGGGPKFIIATASAHVSKIAYRSLDFFAMVIGWTPCLQQIIEGDLIPSMGAALCHDYRVNPASPGCNRRAHFTGCDSGNFQFLSTIASVALHGALILPGPTIGDIGAGHFFGNTGFSRGRPPSVMSKSGSKTVLPCSPTKAGWALIHSLGFCSLA